MTRYRDYDTRSFEYNRAFDIRHFECLAVPTKFQLKCIWHFRGNGVDRYRLVLFYCTLPVLRSIA